MGDILQVVLKRVKPALAERKHLDRVADQLIKRVNVACKKLGINAKPMLVGSAARNTWLRSERDIDIFILLPEDLPREEFERQGLLVARAVAGTEGRERFAEHPYLTTKLRGFDVDLVPCYDITNPSKIKSTVDRSPHHQCYVSKRLSPELTDEVLLTKQFMLGVGCYGSELRVQGFSGYLCELLVLCYGSFKKLVEAASGWKPGVIIDIAQSYPDPAEARALFEGQPLIVIDPVDLSRNVAAAVSMRNFAIFVRACQDFVREPSRQFFFPKPVQKLSQSELSKILTLRETKLYCVTFKAPDIVEDVLYPQLRKAERVLVARLVQAGFEVMRSDVWSNSNTILVIELAVAKLPRVRTHVGPVVSIEAEDFIKSHLESKKFTGPSIDAAGRLVFELERKQTSARKVLKQALANHASLGKHVGEAIANGYRIYRGKEIIELCKDEKVREFISEYLTRCLPWYR